MSCLISLKCNDCHVAKHVIGERARFSRSWFREILDCRPELWCRCRTAGLGPVVPFADLARSQMEYIQLNFFSSEQDGYQVESQMIFFLWQPNQINQISHCFELAGKELS